MLGLVLLAVVGGAGAWVGLTDPFGSPVVQAVPPAHAENLLGNAWSFETTEDSSPSVHWLVPEEAPRGFQFGATGAVSGESAARALAPGDGQELWARILSSDSFRIPSGGGWLQCSAQAQGEGLSLMIRFLRDRSPLFDVVVASSQGAGSSQLLGFVRPPPGATRFQVGLSALGEATVDDIDVRFLSQRENPNEDPNQHTRRGLFTLLTQDPPGMTIFRGEELVVRVEPPSVRSPTGLLLPASVASLLSTSEVAGVGGVRVPISTKLRSEGRQLILEEHLTQLRSDWSVTHDVRVTGSLASSSLGIRSARGFESFGGDFRVDGVEALLLGSTQDRLVLALGVPFTVSATHSNEGTVSLRLEVLSGLRSEWGNGNMQLDVSVQAEFQEERVAAAQLRDSASAHEAADRLGAALADIELLVADYPYDEVVLGVALEARGRIQGIMQAQLDVLDAELEDALFLGSAGRCREVMAAAQRQAFRFQGSEGEQRFLERADVVGRRAQRLLSADVERRRQRIEALAQSFAEHGSYPLVAQELQDYLRLHMAAPADEASGAGNGTGAEGSP